MNTKNQTNKQNEKNQRQKTRQPQGQPKRTQDARKFQEHEHPEMRMTR
jgi:hypothetical protein